MESIKYFPGIMSENITLVSKEYAESVFTTGPVIKEITSSDGSVSVFVNGPKVDLKVNSGGSDDDKLCAFRVYLDHSDTTDFINAVNRFVNNIIRQLSPYGSGILFCTLTEPHIQQFTSSESFSFDNMNGTAGDVITVILHEAYEIDKNEFVQMIKYNFLIPTQDFVELLPKPVYSGY